VRFGELSGRFLVVQSLRGGCRAVVEQETPARDGAGAGSSAEEAEELSTAQIRSAGAVHGDAA
jgi:hypothetical protein